MDEYTKSSILLLVKGVEFRGGSRADLQAFPDAARREVGVQLDAVQYGREPADWKPMRAIGAGVREIRVRGAGGAFRVIYVAKLGEVVYVLHCFQKKTEKTAPRDIALASQRYTDLVRELGQ